MLDQPPSAPPKSDSSGLADRLRALYGVKLQRGNEVGPPDRRPRPEPPPPSAVVLPPPFQVHERQTPEGVCVVAEARFPLDHVHGLSPLASLLDLPLAGVGFLARQSSPPSASLAQAVFLDTETTGLAGGSGTAAFMVGLGRFEDGAFCVRQLFMRDFDEEPALLRVLTELLADASMLVTFNGKSFDVPLLRTRFVLARMGPLPEPDLHLDLLFPSRRLWRERLERRNLGTIEEAILGHRRESDVPSWMIPGLYADYLRERRFGPLRAVFHHNLHDVLSLVSLASHLGRCLAEPIGAGLGPDELLGIARLYEELGLLPEACACLEEARRFSRDVLRERVELALAQLYKRVGRAQQAAELWEALTSRPGASLRSHLELAKHHEHRQRDYAAALEVVQSALAILELRELRLGGRLSPDPRPDLERRRLRLHRRLRAVARGDDPEAVGVDA